MQHAIPKITHLLGPLFYFKFPVKKGHNSKTISVRVLPLVLRLHLVITISNYSKFVVDNFLSNGLHYSFCKMKTTPPTTTTTMLI